MNLTELKQRAKEVFSSIILFCPNFPPLAETNTTKKFEQLIGILDGVAAKVRGKDAEQWLQMCLEEVRQSWESYESGDQRKGADLIQRAEEHFKYAVSKKSTKPAFIAGDANFGVRQVR